MVSLGNGVISRQNLLAIRLGAIESFDEFLVPILEDLEKEISTAEEKLANKRLWGYLQKRRINKMRGRAGQIRVIGHALKRNSSQRGFETALTAIEKLLHKTKRLEARDPKVEKLSSGIALVRDYILPLARNNSEPTTTR